jgi:hypothetical protein
MEIKSQRVPMPVNEARLQEVVLLLMRLPQLQELRLSLHGIEVRRGVEDDEAVVPETVLELGKGLEILSPDVDFLLKRLELEALPLDPNRHQLTTLIEMAERVRMRRLYASAWYVMEGDGLDRFLAQPPGTLPSWLFGIPVNYVSEEQLPEGKLLLVGSTTRHSIDSTYGISADIGG